MNYNSSTISRIADIVLGIRVDRSAAAIAAGTNPIFTVTGGRVALLGLLGEVVTAMDATASTLQINANPTTGDPFGYTVKADNEEVQKTILEAEVRANFKKIEKEARDILLGNV